MLCKKYMLANNELQVHTVESILPDVHFEKAPFPIIIKEHSTVASVVSKSERKALEPDEQSEIASPVVLVKDLATEIFYGGSIYFCEAATNIVRKDRSAKIVGTSVVSVKIGDHCYYGLCDMGASQSAIPYSLYQEVMHEIAPCELKDIDLEIKFANRDVIYPEGIVRDVEVLCGKVKYPTDFLVLGSVKDKF